MALTGVNPLALMGATALQADDQEALLTVKEVSARLGWGPRQGNPRLTESGLQTEYRSNHDKLCYELTESGKPFGVYLDTSRKHGDGTPIRQVKWRASVVEFLRVRYAVMEDAA